MDELVRWLGEQLDVDAARATAAAEELGAEWYYDDGFVLARREGDMVATGSQDFLEAERGRFIAEHDPARVLREVEAKRAVVARYEFACREASRLDLAEDERETWIRVGGALQSVVIQLAAPYAERPGYKAEEWAP